MNGADFTRTHVWNVENLTEPQYLGFHNGTLRTIDHNNYVHGDYIYQANYTSGLRILQIDDAQQAQLSEVGFFDTYPANNGVTFNGAWSVYPFFRSDTVIVNDIQNGLFVLQFDKVRPDLDLDGQINCVDVDRLVAEIVAGTNHHRFDMDGDGAVGLDDLERWRQEAGEALLGNGLSIPVGDANLDGIVDGSDFGVWNTHKFSLLASWCSGDFTADGVVDGSDFALWNANKLTTAGDSLQFVPEPHGFWAHIVFFALARRGGARRKA
jgi:hypothetical protein